MTEHNLPKPMIGVSAVIFNESGQVLLIKRGQAPAKGQWHAPGGKLEPGETMLAACEREVSEETGLSGLDFICLLAVVERQIDGFHYIIIDFLARLKKIDSTVKDPVASDDVVDARWVSEDELPHLELAGGLLPILEQARLIVDCQSYAGLHDQTGAGTDFIPGIKP